MPQVVEFPLMGLILLSQKFYTFVTPLSLILILRTQVLHQCHCTDFSGVTQMQWRSELGLRCPSMHWTGLVTSLWPPMGVESLWEKDTRASLHYQVTIYVVWHFYFYPFKTMEICPPQLNWLHQSISCWDNRMLWSIECGGKFETFN